MNDDNPLTIQIHGIKTDEQKEILDQIWEARDLEDLREIHENQPTEELKNEFNKLLSAVKLALLDQKVETSEDCVEAMDLFWQAIYSDPDV